MEPQQPASAEDWLRRVVANPAELLEVPRALLSDASFALSVVASAARAGSGGHSDDERRRWSRVVDLDWLELPRVPPALLADPDFALQLLREQRDLLKAKYATPSEDQERLRLLWLYKIRCAWVNLLEAPRWLLTDKSFALRLVETSNTFSALSAALRANREVALKAVAVCGCCLKDASEELRADRHVVRVAVRQNELALGYASAVLRGDREFVLSLDTHSSLVLRHVSPELREDDEVRRKFDDRPRLALVPRDIQPPPCCWWWR
jgi:hypothetical protein